MTAVAAMMDSGASGLDCATVVDCLGAGGGPRETLVEKRQNISGEWMSVEKRTASPTGPSSPLIVRTHTPLDRSDSVNPTPRGPFAKSCHHGLPRIRSKKALLRADFRAPPTLTVSLSVVARQKFRCRTGSRAHGLGAQLDCGKRHATRAATGSTPRFQPQRPSRARRRGRRGELSNAEPMG